MSPSFEAGQTFLSNVAIDGLDQFIEVVNSSTISIVADPAGGSRQVIRFNVADTDTAFGLDAPRGQMGASQPFTDGDEIWYGLGVWLPATWQTLSYWLIFAEVYGFPSSGSSAVKLAATGTSIGFQRGADFSFDYPWLMTAPLETWIDVVVHEKLSTDPAVGFVEVWVNTGSGYVKQTFTDTTQRLVMRTQAATHTPGPNRVYVKQYRSELNALALVTSYATDLRLGDSLNAVDPGSY